MCFLTLISVTITLASVRHRLPHGYGFHRHGGVSGASWREAAGPPVPVLPGPVGTVRCVLSSMYRVLWVCVPCQMFYASTTTLPISPYMVRFSRYSCSCCSCCSGCSCSSSACSSCSSRTSDGCGSSGSGTSSSTCSSSSHEVVVPGLLVVVCGVLVVAVLVVVVLVVVVIVTVIVVVVVVVVLVVVLVVVVQWQY